MDDRGRRKTRCGRWLLQVVVLIATCASGGGCLGPKAVRYTRLRYNEVVRDTADEQLLINIEQLLLLTINDINDVPNAPRATLLTPRFSDDNTRFVRGIRLLAGLRARDATELAFELNEENQGASDAIPRDAVQGRDLLNAAR